MDKGKKNSPVKLTTESIKKDREKSAKAFNHFEKSRKKFSQMITRYKGVLKELSGIDIPVNFHTCYGSADVNLSKGLASLYYNDKPKFQWSIKKMINSSWVSGAFNAG